MKKTTCLTALTLLLVLVAAPVALAQNPNEAAVAKAATEGQKLLKPEDLKWNDNLLWVSVIVNEGGVQLGRGYFGAITKGELDALANGSAKGMVKLQQAFYFNDATRLFSRFDALQPGASVSLYQKSAYFRQDSIMRVMPLNRQFVENLAIRGFLKVEGEQETPAIPALKK